MEKITVGTIILDGNNVGIIVNIIESGCWKDSVPLEFLKIFEIRYTDGMLTMIKESSLKRLIEQEKIIVLSY